MYHISITKNGKPLQDMDCNALMLVCTKENEAHTTALHLADEVTTNTVLNELFSFDKLKEETLEQHAKLKVLYTLGKAMGGDNKNEEIDLSEMLRAVEDRIE